MFATNVIGLVNMTQAVLPIFLARADGGHGDVINIGSGAGRHPYVGGGIYCATKAALRSFSESLRQELVATRIRVIEIDPGQVETVGRKTRFMLNRFSDFAQLTFPRTSPSSGLTATRARPMPSMRMSKKQSS